MRVGYNNEPYQIIVDTPNKLTGLTDVVFTIFNSGGTVVTGSPFAATEIASSGVYTASWTPTAAGDYVIEVSSVSESISEVSGAVRIEENSNTDVVNTITALNNISATDVWDAASRTLTDKTGFALDAAEYANIAAAVETAIINEGDSQQVIDAIVQAVGNENITEAVLVSAITADLERTGGLLKTIETKVDNLQSSLGTGGIKFNIIN